MKILISGATGMIGTALVKQFSAKHQLGLIGRNIDKINRCITTAHQAYDWEMIEKQGAEIIAKYDVIINLAGENIGDKRWSKQQKERILMSRVKATTLLAKEAAKAHNPALHVYNASAIGIYDFAADPSRQAETLFTEYSPLPKQPKSFVAQVAAAWEHALEPATAAGLKVTTMRFAVVLNHRAGALAKLLPSFKLGLGAVLGSGQQPFSWIALDDLVRAIDFLVQHPSITGPINLVAPDVLSQRQFAKTLAAMLHRPCWMHLPAFMVRSMFGEMAEELLLNGQAVSGAKLQSAGFSFKVPTFDTLSIS